MSKRHFIALADAIRIHNQHSAPFDTEHLKTLVAVCKSANPNFNADRWLDYIAGRCGPNGGTVKP
jgi:hypothetical protein